MISFRVTSKSISNLSSLRQIKTEMEVSDDKCNLQIMLLISVHQTEGLGKNEHIL
jgi:hypothetical protein